ncbi:MAG: ATP-binding protein [Kineosporiaceae bacterium]|jgi:anti-sigma regulatory factor (Ser/Thr protein kinase)
MKTSNAWSHPTALPPAEVLRLPHRPDSVTVARRTLRAALGRMGLAEPIIDDAEVVVSELLGNAVRHARAIAGGVLVLGWQLRGGQLQVRVTDGGSGRVVEAQEPSLTAVSGRGLHIVERLSECWGVNDHAGGLRTVWAALSLDRTPALRLVR